MYYYFHEMLKRNSRYSLKRLTDWLFFQEKIAPFYKGYKTITLRTAKCNLDNLEYHQSAPEERR
jgi:hypothetical protein